MRYATRCHACPGHGFAHSTVQSDNTVRIVPLPLSLRTKGVGDEAAGGSKSA